MCCCCKLQNLLKVFFKDAVWVVFFSLYDLSIFFTVGQAPFDACSIQLKKIRIGNVLKSADVETLFSRRNSENSSHTHTHTCAYPHTPVHTNACLCTPMHSFPHPHTPMHTSVHLHALAHTHTPAHTHTHQHSPAHTHAHPHAHPTHPCTPHTYPLMPADALNLTNHIKLHVNGKMAERQKEDRKKKEQESAEAISGLKIASTDQNQIKSNQIFILFLFQRR